MPLNEARLYNDKTGPLSEDEQQEKFEIRPLSPDDIQDAANGVFEKEGGANEVFVEGPAALVEGLTTLENPITAQDLQDQVTAEETETGNTYEQFEPGEFDSEISPDTLKNWGPEGFAESSSAIHGAINESGEAQKEGDIDKSIGIASKLIDSLEASVKGSIPEEYKNVFNDLRAKLSEAIDEGSPAAKEALYKFVCGACDFIPIAGPLKMLIEAVAGKTLGGDELKGWGRFLHGTEGLIFLAVDCTGAGAALTKGAKGVKVGGKGVYAGAKLAPKLMTRTAALLRYVKAPRKVYKPVFKAGTTLARHPKLAEIASKGVRAVAKTRELRRSALTTAAKKEAKSTVISAVKERIMPTDPVAHVNEREGMQLEPPTGQTFDIAPDESEEVAMAA
ncbi:MAG: hypothetical protein Q8P90_00895 [bacterium]|nr:hypothetical protein [bacterium]